MRGMLINGLLVLACGLFQSAQAAQAGLPDGVNAGRSAHHFAALGLQRGMMQGGGPGMGMAGRGVRGRRPGAEMLLRLRGELGLDKSQVEKIKDIRLETARQSLPIRSKLEVAELELRDMLDDPKVDLKKVEGKVREVSGMRGDLSMAQIKARVETMEVLTPEQREKAAELRFRRPAGRDGERPGPRAPGMRRGPRGMGSGPENGE